jgi:hypothetical protein
MESFTSLNEMFEQVLGAVKPDVSSAKEKRALLEDHYTEIAKAKVHDVYKKEKEIYEKNLLDNIEYQELQAKIDVLSNKSFILEKELYEMNKELKKLDRQSDSMRPKSPQLQPVIVPQLEIIKQLYKKN